MNPLSKIKTLLRLAARGDWKSVQRRWYNYTAPSRSLRNGDNAFVFRDPGFSCVCHPSWPDSLDHFLGGEGDHWEAGLLRRWLQPGETAIDIGTNTGFYAFAMAGRVGAKGQVLAVDADAFIVDKLDAAKQLLRKPQIKPVHAAVANEAGSLMFYIRKERSVTTEQSLISSGDDDVAVVTPSVTLKNLIDMLDRPMDLSVIKIDIEGAEAMAFAGAPPGLISSDGPLWLCEINAGALARFGARPADITSLFTCNDFDNWLLPKHPVDLGSQHETLRRLETDETFTDSIYYNLLAIPRGARWEKQRNKVDRFMKIPR